MDFLTISGCETFQERIAPKPIEIDMDKLHIKFSALNVDVDGPSLDFLGSKKPSHEGIKSRDEMAGDRLTVCEQKLLQTFARLVSISLNFLLQLQGNNDRNWKYKYRGVLDCDKCRNFVV